MNNGIRIGKISAVHYDTGAADVLFEDDDDNVMVWLPIVSSEYQMPRVGSMVLVAFEKNNQGFIIGQYYGKSCIPEKTGKDVFFKRLSPNSFVYYDPETDILEISAGKVVIRNLSEE